MIQKTVQKKEEYYIQFTDEEMDELNIKPNTKFSFKINDDNSVSMVPYETIQLDLKEFSKEQLIKIIYAANEADVTIEEFITSVLEEYLPRLTEEEFLKMDYRKEMDELLKRDIDA
jgi:hypothetical protein